MSVRPWSETIPEAKHVLASAGYALVIEHLEARLREADRLLSGFVYDDYDGDQHDLTVDTTAWLAAHRDENAVA